MRRQPVLYRHGAGTVFGFPKLAADVFQHRAKVHMAHGIPRARGAAEVENFLQAQSWEQISNIVEKRSMWPFFGLCPKEETQLGTIQLLILTIAKWFRTFRSKLRFEHQKVPLKGSLLRTQKECGILECFSLKNLKPWMQKCPNRGKAPLLLRLEKKSQTKHCKPEETGAAERARGRRKSSEEVATFQTDESSQAAPTETLIVQAIKKKQTKWTV